MRTTFVQTLARLAAEDARTVLLTADLGFMALEPFSDRYPDRFFNVGVSEQNMIGMATGLAEAGLVPYCYSIAPFASLRPYEFIRNGPVLHRTQVRIVGVGGGFEYAHAGPTHHGIDDIGALRVQNGLTIVSPADAGQTASAMEAVHNVPGPVYLRIGKDDHRQVRGLDGRFELGRAQIVRQGTDVVLITLGSIAAEVVEAADELCKTGISAMVVVVASVNPAPAKHLEEILCSFGIAITVEAHSVTGGLGSMVCEIVAEAGLRVRVIRRGVTGKASDKTGSESYLHRLHRLDRDSIVQLATSTLETVQ